MTRTIPIKVLVNGEMQDRSISIETEQRVDNVYIVDTKMFGFSKWCSAFLVSGKDGLALIDTGPATSVDAVRAGIEAHSLKLTDISHIFITHIHFDHCGAAGLLAREMPKAKVLVHSRVAKHIIDPSIMMANIKRDVGEKMAARFGELVPIPAERVQGLNDGDVFDLGGTQRLRVIFAPGHAPHEIVIYDEKNKGLFAGDATGLYFAEEDALLVPCPPGSDLKLAMETLKILINMPITKLFIGHYGICNKPKDILQRGIEAIRLVFDVASETIQESKPEEIANRIRARCFPAEVERLRQRKPDIEGNSLYDYITGELIPMWAGGFVRYYQKQQQSTA